MNTKQGINTHNPVGILVAIGGLSFLLSLIPNLSFLIYVTAVAYWSVLIKSLVRLNRRNRFQVLFLLGAGVLCLISAILIGENRPEDFTKIAQANLGLISMLVGVSFLSLLPGGSTGKGELFKLKGALSTWGSVHLLGAVINLSSVFLVGDRLSRDRAMSDGQLSVLVRGLTSAGFWSPFFAAMAVALSVAPNATYLDLIKVGIPVSWCACVFSMWELNRAGRLDDFRGFPISASSLLFPLILATLVLIIHYQVFESLPILSIVTLICPLCVVVFLTLRCGTRRMQNKLLEHTSTRLPNMINEISLFVAAGFMSGSASLLVNSFFGQNWALFESFGFWPALCCYLTICFISLLGLHPIVGISLMSALVPFDEVNNTLLAFVCLSAWAVGTSIGPLSGINLSVAGKYQVDNFRLSRLNVQYGVFMSIAVAIAMYVLTRLLNV